MSDASVRCQMPVPVPMMPVPDACTRWSISRSVIPYNKPRQHVQSTLPDFPTRARFTGLRRLQSSTVKHEHGSRGATVLEASIRSSMPGEYCPEFSLLALLCLGYTTSSSSAVLLDRITDSRYLHFNSRTFSLSHNRVLR